VKIDQEKFQELVLKKLEQLNTLTNNVTGIKTEITGMKTEMAEMNRKISNIQEQTANNTEFQAETKEFQAEVRNQLEKLADSNEVIEGMLGEHEFALRKLRLEKQKYGASK